MNEDWNKNERKKESERFKNIGTTVFRTQKSEKKISGQKKKKKKKKWKKWNKERYSWISFIFSYVKLFVWRVAMCVRVSVRQISVDVCL